MASTYTNLGLENPGTGDQSGTWGVTENEGRTLTDQAIAGWLMKSVAGNSDVTLTTTVGTANEWRNAVYQFTGALTGNINVIVPTNTKIMVVYNNTSGAFTLKVKTSGGTGAFVSQGTIQVLGCDGTNVISLVGSLSLPLAVASGGTGAGTASAARTNLGSTTVGDAVFIAADAAAARTAIEAVIGVDVEAYDASIAKTGVAQNWTLPQRVGFIGLTDASTVAWDLDTAPNASVTFGASRIMGAPTNIRDGQICVLKVTGAFQVSSWNAAFDFGTAGAPTLTASATKHDYLTFIGKSTTTLDFVSIVKGFTN